MKKFIVTIEDNPNDIQLIKRIFDREIKDVSLQHIASGEEAIKVIEDSNNFVNLPSLILLDIKMKGINGLKVLKQLKKHQHLQKVPVVIFSSSVQLSDLEKAYELKVNSYIEKPKDYQQLKDTVKMLVNYWLHYNKN